jgi:signal transduction histidine kinase
VVASAVRRDPAVRLEVADTGEGIPAEDLPHIWDKFYRADTPGRRDWAGAGLGLALVKQLSQAMHAQVGVESTLGEGSTFWIEFMIHSGARPSPGSSNSVSPEAHRQPDVTG